MNIFYLHSNPFKAAEYQYGKHVVKMVLESAQMLCTAHHHYGNGDNVPYKKDPLIDNWDLSVKRATSVVRVLVELGVESSRLIAAGRGEYQPVASNDTAENRAKNRRTRIIVLPKIDEFYDMIEQEMKKLSAAGN